MNILGEKGIAQWMEDELRHLDEVSTAAEVAPPLPGEAESAPPLPSPDQRFFNESLRAGVRSLGSLVRDRKKKK